MTTETWHEFERGSEYEAFFVKRKNIKFGMTTIEKLNKSKSPIVKIDKTLEKLRAKNLFPEKLAKANEVIARVGLPKK